MDPGMIHQDEYYKFVMYALMNITTMPYRNVKPNQELDGCVLNRKCAYHMLMTFNYDFNVLCFA